MSPVAVEWASADRAPGAAAVLLVAGADAVELPPLAELLVRVLERPPPAGVELLLEDPQPLATAAATSAVTHVI
jgi:hypothetical protein